MSARNILLRISEGMMKALLEGFMAGDERVLQSVDASAVMGRIREHLRSLPFFYAFGLMFALFFFDFFGPLSSGKWRPFSFLPLRDRLQVLDRWSMESTIWKRTLFMGIRFLFLNHIYSEPKLLEAIGYGPALVDREAGLCR